MKGIPLAWPAAALLTCLAVSTAVAQPPGRGPGGPGGPGGSGGPGGREGRFGGGPPVFPIMQAIDADGDGELSAQEIQNAAVALKTLDKDKDGKLSAEELRPEFGRFGGRGPGGGPGGEGPEALVSRMMAFDKDGDSKLGKDELPERMQTLMDRADTNKDGFLDRAELTAFAAQQTGRGPGRGGEGFGRPGGRGEGGPGPRGGDGEPGRKDQPREP